MRYYKVYLSSKSRRLLPSRYACHLPLGGRLFVTPIITQIGREDNLSAEICKHPYEKEPNPAVILFDRSAKGEEGKLHKFEALNSARDAYDRDAVEDAHYKIGNGEFPTAEDCPKNICDGMLAKIQVNLFSKGPEG